MVAFITMAIPNLWSIGFIVLLVLLLFGAKKIPDMMKGVGRGVKEFKDAVNKDYSAEEGSSKSESKPENKKIEE
ncbi:MAG: twin-arginine translocase TatA/TatE family subunit [Alistipes sp.]|jgi:sec-independent protein translocase protein TatA|nr:twin-arginine translocase TatA/TatE family subunit [Alistipes sp.]